MTGSASLLVFVGSAASSTNFGAANCSPSTHSLKHIYIKIDDIEK
jgi:hypothetical protein